MTSRALILGCTGSSLSAEERSFFRDVKPWGFILFKRNIGSPDEVRALTGALRDCVGSDRAPILIDQEGAGSSAWVRPTGRPTRPAAAMDA